MNFNYNWYKKQLSPFGQKVLKFLQEECHSENVCQSNLLKQRDKNIRRQQKVLSFRDSNSDTPQNHLHYSNGSEERNKLLFLEKDISVTSEIVSSTPREPLGHLLECIDSASNSVLKQSIAASSYQLLSSKTLNLGQDEEVFSRDDLINSAVEQDPEKQVREYQLAKKTLNFPDIISNPIYNPNDVTWNNMFDTELFYDDGIANKLQNAKDDIERCNNIESLIANNRSPGVNKQITADPEVMKNGSNKKLNKRKIENEHQNTNTVKKVCINKKDNIRKEKYTKTVKNWLKDVNKNNINEVENPVDVKKNSHLNSHNKHKNDTMKKTVQAQLKNKGGKMKFEKPKKNNDMKEIDEKTDECSNVASIKEIKETKAKSKFMPPIKSQLPVKEVTYEVIELDETNIEDYRSILIIHKDKPEVVVVLVYRNGFCQLNSNYTEDTCIPEGLLICLNDKFFYIKNELLLLEKPKKLLTDILGSCSINCYEGKIILIYLAHCNFNIELVSVFDAKIGGALLDPDNIPESFLDLQKLISFSPEYTIATDSSLQKTAWYTTLLQTCVVKLKDLLIENSLLKIFLDIEMKLVPIIAEMESVGITVDLEKLRSMEQILLSKMKSAEQACHIAAGRVFQINSPTQVRALLYDELRLDTKSQIKVKETITTGAKSTSEAALRTLMTLHPLPKLILEYRHLHKAHATFLTGIAQHVKNGVVRPTWVQIAAATGRIASNNPNLQAIPKAPFSLIMFPESDEIDNPSLNFRSVYTAREGCLLLAADFKHVECRVFAHAAADAALLAVLARDQDLFTVLAAKWLNKSESEISSADRERTKRIVYASLYGAGARKLMDILDVGYEQALQVAASFNRTFPSLKAFGRSVVAQCGREGRLRSLCGRLRRFTDIGSADAAVRAHAERQAVNFIVQGSAADLCKTAMVQTSLRLRGSGARLLLQIHDELVWELPAHCLPRVAGTVKQVMEECGRACGLRTRLPVAVAAGADWAHMDPVHL